MAVDSLIALIRPAVIALLAFAFGYAVGVAQCVQLVAAFFDEGSR